VDAYEDSHRLENMEIYYVKQLQQAGTCIASIVIGMFLVLQTILNSSMSHHFSIPIWGSVNSFGVALALLTFSVYVEVTVHNGRQRYGNDTDEPNKLPFLLMATKPRWFHLLPGLIGLVYVTGALVMTAYIGTALFFLPLVIGQISGSTFLDIRGIGKPAEPLTIRKVFVIVTTLAGAALTVFGKIKDSLQSLSVSVGVLVVCVVLAFMIGTSIPFQAMLNRRVAAELVHGSKLQATWWSFCVGFLISLVVLTVQLCLDTKHANQFPARYADSLWYMYLGGPLGLVYVLSGVVFTGIIGFEGYFVSIITGQLLCSLIIESYGLLTVHKQKQGVYPYIGVGLVILSVSVNAFIPKSYDYAVILQNNLIAQPPEARQSLVSVRAVQVQPVSMPQYSAT
jgi:transporter family-2 protein